MQEIICVLDKSGSMQTVSGDALGGLNKFVEDQKAVGPANITIAWFDDGYEVAYEGLLSELQPFKEWPNGGMTALRDAIGKTFNHVRERFAKEKPEKVVLAILTDGFENSSREFTPQDIKNLITEHQEKYAWDVIFLAADQDAWDTAHQFGISQANSMGYSSSATREGFDDYSKAVTRSRMS